MREIKRGENCFYMGDSPETAYAKISWTPSVKNVLIIESTVVDKEHEGQGLARKLVEATAKMAREENKKLIATCTYAKKVLEGSEKYRGLLQQWGSSY